MVSSSVAAVSSRASAGANPAAPAATGTAASAASKACAVAVHLGGGAVVARLRLQGDLLDEDRQEEGDQRGGRGVQEDVGDTVAVGDLHDRTQRTGQRVQVGDAPATGTAVAQRGTLGAEVGEAVLDVVRDAVAEHRAERRDADRAAEAAEERDDGAGRTDVLGGDRVLHDQDEVLHQHADAGADR